MHYEDLLGMLKDTAAREYNDTDVDTLDCAPIKTCVVEKQDEITYDLLIKNARVVTMDPDNRIIERASVAIKNGMILLITADNKPVKAKQVINADEKIITPGLIDCHTHLIYACNRAADFSQRINGESSAEINTQRGGFLSTVKATQHASIDELTYLADQRATVMLAHGTTTVEIKSGYGLDLNTEIKILTAAKMLDKKLGITVIPTFLCAHATPIEYKNNPEGYMDYLISTMLPVIAKKKLAVFVDAFCESSAFSSVEVERLFQAATQHGFKLKLHAEQLIDQKGALMAACYDACSVDHLEYLAPDDCKHLANDKTVAVLLPGAFYFLKESKQPPIAALRNSHIPIAIATDANPETSPFLTLPLMMNMACILFGLSVEEAWQGVTINAAKALNLADQLGSIEIGKKADLIIWSTDSVNDVVYNPTINFCRTIVKSGAVIGGG